MREIRRVVLCAVALNVTLSACGTDAADTVRSAAAASPGDDGSTYCTEQGGMLVERTATWNTNADPSAWLTLAGTQTFCEFESTADGNTTRIAVDLTTLSSAEPTLAAMAYLSKVPTTLPASPSSNPASFSCTNDLGGASQFGPGVAGGGWVNASEPVFSVIQFCVFADGSMIDEFGIWYHANDTVRGADLTGKFRYQPGDQLPAIFGGS